MKKIYNLFFTFFKIGAFTFGGGYAMIPLMQREVVDKNKWITEEEMMDIVAIGESTPGPISINVATFVGYKLHKFWGAFFSTLGIVLPSFIVILIISYFLNDFMEIEIVRYAFSGIRVAIIALIIKALYSMYKQCSKNLLTYIIICLSFILITFFNINAIYVIILSALIALIYSFLFKRRNVK